MSKLREILGEAWDGAKPMFDHGRTEVAAAMFHGNAAHVMYMRDGDNHGQDDKGHGLPPEANKQIEMDGPSM